MEFPERRNFDNIEIPEKIKNLIKSMLENNSQDNINIYEKIFSTLSQQEINKNEKKKESDDFILILPLSPSTPPPQNF